MSCGGLSNADSDYRNILDRIEELINKYCLSHSVVLLGDLNASLTLSRDTNFKGQNSSVLL